MKILAFDSAAKIATVAVTEDSELLALYSINNGLTQSELLLPMAENMLASLRLGISDIDLLATSVGPGSFTGVRIGTALIKGLAFGKNIPCVGVSALEELAENLSGLDGIIVPAMDARRSQVYNAIFRCKGGSLTRLTEDRAISVSELGEELKAYEGEKIYVSGDGYDGVKRALDSLGVKVEDTPPLLIPENAYSVARIAHRMYLRGEYTNDLGINPTYLRMPQAERERLERIKESEGK